MNKDECDLLEVLKGELEFLERGEYEHSSPELWRPRFIFEDSPTCMNYGSPDQRGTCNDCVLMQLVPRAFRAAKTPCRHIPFNVDGETLDSLYRYADQCETQEIFGKWLRATIQGLEEERKGAYNTSKQPTPSGEAVRGTPLNQDRHPKCANPACPAAFHWLAGGKFLRFRPDSGAASANHPKEQIAAGLHNAKHYWFCERCSHVFTLAYDEGAGVVVRLVWPELRSAAPPKQLMSEPRASCIGMSSAGSRSV